MSKRNKKVTYQKEKFFKQSKQNAHKQKKQSGEDWINKIFSFFAQNIGKSFNYKQVASGIGAKKAIEKELILRCLETLSENGKLKKISRSKYTANSLLPSMDGVLEKEGTLFFVTSEKGEKIFISENSKKNALCGDCVRVLIRKGKRNEKIGHITEILKRKKDTFVGVIIEKKQNFLFQTNFRELEDVQIFIPSDKLNGASAGDKVIAKMESWPQKGKAFAEVVENLGKEGENNTEMHAILAEFDLPHRYPEACEKEAEKLSEDISSEEIGKREDCRNKTTFTIDPETAKDFDDALSIEHLPDNKTEVGVHIADVSYYVKENSLIDKEAYERATSIYLVDRTIPMLPEKLCNDLCSLKPGVNRLAFSVIFTFAKDLQLVEHRVRRTIIQSDRRFTYQEAQLRIDTQEGDFASEILSLHTIAQHLRKERFKNGAINFDGEEVGFVLDENGKPVEVKTIEHGTANELIEEFMLLANRTIAEDFGKKGMPSQEKSDNEKKRELKEKYPFVFRVHDRPDPEKVGQTLQFFRQTKMYEGAISGNKLNAQTLNKVFAATETTPYANIIQMMLIRTMARALYTTENIGHYGLAFPFYTHFTSPIRRYPDVMVHRLVTKYTDKKTLPPKAELEERCTHCSEREHIADLAERASVKYKQAEYLNEHLGKIFDGFITGVTKFGLYVTLSYSGCEGLVPIRLLKDDHYIYDEENYRLIGRDRKKEYRMGDFMRIKVKEIDLSKRLIDFEPIV